MSLLRKGPRPAGHDRSEWRVQVFFMAHDGEGAYEPQLITGERRARDLKAELEKSFPDSNVRVECEPWDWTKDRLAASVARFG